MAATFFRGTILMHVQTGIYRHYKGKEYQVFQVATHSETLEQFVVYRCLYGEYSWWVRPLSMFTETVTIAGETLPRFQLIRALESEPDLPSQEKA